MRGARGAYGGVGIVLFAAILGMLNYVARRHYLRGDWTRADVYSLSDKTRDTLRRLDRDVQVTVFMFRAMGDEEGEQVRQDVEELLERFRRDSPRLRLESIDPDRDPKRTELLAKRYEIKTDDLALGGLVVFASGKRHKYVTRDAVVEYEFTGDAGERRLTAFTGEAKFLEALLAVVETKQSLLCFTSGHGEYEVGSFEEAGLSAFEEELKRDNYRTRTLGARALEAPVPGECDALIVVGPQRAFASSEVETIDAHLKAGGRALLLLGPVLDSNVRGLVVTGMEGLAERWGMRVGESIVVDETSVPGRYPYLTWAAIDGFRAHPIGAAMKGKPVIFTLPREVRARGGDGAEAQDIVASSDAGWGETSFAFLRGEGELRFDAATDVKGPVPIAAAVEKAGTGARLVVVGTSDFLSNAQLRGAVRDYSRDFALASIGWLLKKESRVAVGPKTPEHFKLTLTDEQLMSVLLVCFLGLPLLALGGGAAVWWRRRR